MAKKKAASKKTKKTKKTKKRARQTKLKVTDLTPKAAGDE